MVEGVVVASAGYRTWRWFEQRSCRDKVRMTARGEARNAARFLTERGGGTIRPYRCGFCRGWHAGHPMRPARTRRCVEGTDGELDGRLGRSLRWAGRGPRRTGTPRDRAQADGLHSGGRDHRLDDPRQRQCAAPGPRQAHPPQARLPARQAGEGHADGTGAGGSALRGVGSGVNLSDGET